MMLSTKTYFPSVIGTVIVCFLPTGNTLPSPGDVMPFPSSSREPSFNVGSDSGAMSVLRMMNS